jgi:hypothetical protein
MHDRRTPFLFDVRFVSLVERSEVHVTVSVRTLRRYRYRLFRFHWRPIKHRSCFNQRKATCSIRHRNSRRVTMGIERDVRTSRVRFSKLGQVRCLCNRCAGGLPHAQLRRCICQRCGGCACAPQQTCCCSLSHERRFGRDGELHDSLNQHKRRVQEGVLDSLRLIGKDAKYLGFLGVVVERGRQKEALLFVATSRNAFELPRSS